MPDNLNEPLLDNGILNTNYFNGRILDADAFQTDQLANRQQHGQLGRAIGDGIAWGLEVTINSTGSSTTTPIVNITQGLAFNRLGQAVELLVTGPDPIDCSANPNAASVDYISLALSTVTDSPAPSADLFAACSVPAPTVNTLTGVFLLVMSPASGYQESAPAMSLAVSGASAGCGSRYAVEGVTFRLVGFPTDSVNVAADVGALTFQNQLAYRCFGVQEQLDGLNGNPSFDDDPLDFVGPYGAIDELRTAGALTDCDVPLALLYQNASALQFCDMWAVRRPVVPRWAPDVWPLHAGQRRLAEGMAMFLQYQDQIAGMYQNLPNLPGIVAKDYFQFLPAAGYLRIKSGEFDRDTFFTGLTLQRYTLDPSSLRLLIDTSWRLDPIDLSAAAPPQLDVYESSAADGYLLFIRADASAPIVAAPPPPPPPPVGNGSIAVYASLADDPTLSDEDLSKLITVTVMGSNGTFYPSVFVPSSRFFKLQQRSRRPLQAHFEVSALPADTYLVRVTALKHSTVSRSILVTAGDEESMTVALTPSNKLGGKFNIPEKVIDAGWLTSTWYANATVIPKAVDWTPREDLPNWIVQPDPPPEVVSQMHDWADWVQQENPDAPVDSTSISVLVDPSYTPSQIADDYYAYMQFGPNGAYVPLVLTATNQALGRAVSLDKGALPGVDSDMIASLAAAGVSDLSVLASSPKSLVAGALGLSSDAGQGLISAGQTSVANLNGSVLQFNGVSADVQRALAALNIGSDVALANADPAALTQAVGDAAFASRLVEEAQSAVPASSWSVSAPSVGLSGGEIQALSEKGIFTLGQVAAAQAAATAAGTAPMLGIAVDQVARISQVFQSVGAQLAAARAAAAPITSLNTVDPQAALALASAGLGNVQALAGANVNTIAAELGGQTELATRILAEAQGARAVAE